MAAVLELFKAGERLLEADYRGHPLTCGWGNHRKAVHTDTIALGGAAASAACMTAGYLEKSA